MDKAYQKLLAEQVALRADRDRWLDASAASTKKIAELEAELVQATGMTRYEWLELVKVRDERDGYLSAINQIVAAIEKKGTRFGHDSETMLILRRALKGE